MTEHTWGRWMLGVDVESTASRYDRASGYEECSMTFRFPSDPESFHGFLGEQVRPCVYRPTRVFAENFLGFQDELVEADPETMEIYNVSESAEGLEGVRVGYHFRLRFRWRDRWADFFG